MSQPLGAGARAGEGRAAGARAPPSWAGQSHPADALRHWRPRAHAARGRARRPRGRRPRARRLRCGLLQFGWRQGLSDDEVEAVWREGLALAERSGNAWAECALQGSYAALARDGGRGLGGARACPRSAASRRRAARHRARDERWRHGPTGWPCSASTRAAIEGMTERIERMGEDYDLGRRVIGFSMLSGRRSSLARARRERSHRGGAHRGGPCGAARPRARRHRVAGLGHTQYALLDYFSGEVRDGLEHARAGTEIAERIGSGFSRAIAYCVMGYAHLARGEWVEAIEVEEEALRIMSDTRTGLQYEPLALAALAEASSGLTTWTALGDGSARRRGGRSRRHAAATRRTAAWCSGARSHARARPRRARSSTARLSSSGTTSLSFVPRVDEALADLAAMHGPRSPTSRSCAMRSRATSASAQPATRGGCASASPAAQARRSSRPVQALTPLDAPPMQASSPSPRSRYRRRDQQGRRARIPPGPGRPGRPRRGARRARPARR